MLSKCSHPAFGVVFGQIGFDNSMGVLIEYRKICGRNSVVECQLPKLNVVGSNPIARFFHLFAHRLCRRQGLRPTTRSTLSAQQLHFEDEFGILDVVERYI